MTDFLTQNDQSLADQLAAACGAGDLCAAAAIDAEEGDKFLRARLPDQMAAAHLLTMRMAALADRAISAAAGGAAQGSDNRSLFDLAAARFAGAAARLNGRYCRALQTLRALPDPAAEEEDDVEWAGIPHMLVQYLTPEEKARRINREKFYDSFMRPVEESDSESKPREVSVAERACLAAAVDAARALLAETGADSSLAATSNGKRTKLFAQQLAVTHRLTMRLTGRADRVMTTSVDPLDRPEGLRLAHGAARLMERFRQGVAMLHRLRSSPDGPRRIRNYWAGHIREDDAERERAEDIANGLDPDTCLPIEKADPATATSGGRPSPVLLRRGRLKNGNPGGDFLAAPRCGAKTRSGCACRQPAMANDRCRFHGGKSTGPRTEAGRAQARRNRLVHGLRSAEVIGLSAAAAAAYRSLGALLAAARRQMTEDRGQKASGSGTALKPAAPDVPADAFCPPSSVLCPPAPAGHGVDRSESSIAAGSATILPFTRRPKTVRSPCRSRLPRVRS